MRLWRPAGGGRQTDIRTAPAGARSARPRPRGPDGPAACSPAPGEPPPATALGRLGQLPLPAPSPPRSPPKGRGSPACSSRPVHLADGTCREPEATQQHRAGLGSLLSRPGPQDCPQRSHLVPRGGGGQGSHPDYT